MKRERELLSEKLPRKIIAITGTIASGKSTVLNLIKEMGYEVINTDSLSKEVMVPENECFSELVREFGGEILRDDGSIDRKRLLEMVATDPIKLKKLESIVHPQIFKLMVYKLQRLKEEGNDVVFVEVPLLFEGNWQDFFDYTIIVTSREDIIEDRIKKRFEGDLRMLNMMLELKKQHYSQEKKARMSHFVIENSDDNIHLLKTKIKEILDIIC